VRASEATSQEEVHSRGFTIRYLAAGPPDGDVLLLVHGVLQSAARWADMGYLDALSVYMGGKEVFLDMARATAEEIGAEFAVIEGRGHAGAFQDLPAVEPLVRSFLARARAT
jgi:hypothetical protein